MAEHEVIKGQMHTECIGDCDTVCSFLKLTDEMTRTILELDEELIRWRQALIKYLPPEWAEGLKQDIFNNTSRDFEGDPAYDRSICQTGLWRSGSPAGSFQDLQDASACQWHR